MSIPNPIDPAAVEDIAIRLQGQISYLNDVLEHGVEPTPGDIEDFLADFWLLSEDLLRLTGYQPEPPPLLPMKRLSLFERLG